MRCGDCHYLRKGGCHYNEGDTTHYCTKRQQYYYKDEVFVEWKCSDYKAKIGRMKLQNEYGDLVAEFMAKKSLKTA